MSHVSHAPNDPDVIVEQGQDGDVVITISKIEVADKRSWYSGERTQSVTRETMMGTAVESQASGITEIKARVRVTWHKMNISERILAASGIDIATIQ